jgi:hypothetical protein
MVAMALAVWSKPTSVIFPVLVLGIDWLRCPCLSDKAWAMRMLLVLPFFVISLLGGSMGWIAHAEVKPMYIPFWVTPVLAALNLGAYCWKTIIPVYLHYPYLFIRALPSWYVFLSFGVGLAVVWLFSMFSSAIRRNHRELFGIGILFCASLMLVLFRPVGWQSHADRFIYVAGIWVSLGISLWLVRQPTKRFWGGVLVCGVVCVLLGRLSWRQATYWQNDATLFARAEACSKPGMNVFANKGLMLDAYRRRDLRACLAIAQKQRIAWMDNYVSGMVPVLVLLSYEQRRGDMVRKIHDDLQKNYLIHLQKRVSKVSDSRMTSMYPDSSGLSFPMQINNNAMLADPEAEEHEIIKQLYVRSLDFCTRVIEILDTKDMAQARQQIAKELEQNPRSIEWWYLSGLLSKQTRDFEGMKKAWEFCLRNDPSYAFLEKEMRR